MPKKPKVAEKLPSNLWTGLMNAFINIIPATRHLSFVNLPDYSEYEPIVQVNNSLGGGGAKLRNAFHVGGVAPPSPRSYLSALITTGISFLKL